MRNAFMMAPALWKYKPSKAILCLRPRDIRGTQVQANSRNVNPRLLLVILFRDFNLGRRCLECVGDGLLEFVPAGGQEVELAPDGVSQELGVLHHVLER